MKIRVEVSPLATTHQSGVASYTKLLVEAFAKNKDLSVYGHYFNFLNRQPRPDFVNNSLNIEEDKRAPLRVYAKAHSHGVSVPFDAFLPKVDLTIFTNFATWPTINSKLRATVIHDLTYVYYPELVEEANLAHLRRVVPRSIHTADFIITISESVKNELINEFKISPDKITITPIPPEDIFKQKHSQQDLKNVREKYNIGSKDYIYFLGNFEPRKNLKTLIEAYCKLPKDIKDRYQLVLSGGKGWKSDEAQKALDDAIAAGEDIKHIGYVDSSDRPALYQSASLFVMPSLYEGFGIPILEAMLSGCPVIAADIPVLRETGGSAALYVDPANTDVFAETIENALKTYPYSKEDMLKNVNRFSWDKNVQLVLDKTKSLLKS
jgi:glycosyltransferase involved in cell wall biosynthesis